MPAIGNELVAGKLSSPRCLAHVSTSGEDVCRLIFAAASPTISVAELRGPSRTLEVCRRRFAVVFAARKFLAADFEEIGRAMNRDHSTAVRCYSTAKILRNFDPSFRAMCDALADALPPHQARRIKAKIERAKRQMERNRQKMRRCA